MPKSKSRLQYSAEVRERAVRMLHEKRNKHASRWAAVTFVAGKIGCTPQTLDNWTKQAERDNAGRTSCSSGDHDRAQSVQRTDPRSEMMVLEPAGLSHDERERLRALERENLELRQANERLRKASVQEVGDVNAVDLNRREKILWIASRSFLSKGYSATSIDEIAEAVGTSGPALYRHFESKQDILDKIILIGLDVKMKGLKEATEKNYSDPKQTLRDIVRHRIEFAFGPWGCQDPMTDAEYQHLSPPVALKVDTVEEINKVEWFKYLTLIRPDVPTRIILSLIASVMMEITYVGHQLHELDLKEDIRPYLERIAWAGLMA
jgi:transposase